MTSRKSPRINRKGEVGDLSELDPGIFRRLKQLPNSLQRKMRGRPKLEHHVFLR
jgi:hypothetical protein